MKPFAVIVLLLTAGAIAFQCGKQTAEKPYPVKPHPKGYVACKSAQPLVIDGQLADAAWLSAPWTDDFLDIEGDTRPEPRFRTRAKMLLDDTYFYVVA